ncbi:hypothetical protein [Conexibacter sp. CPCC 206217]|uniref:hypothetical protein n=1 Tax=Conexibacter sp. CPCC 206217 TaxID=3064574 RepID=UPI002721C0EC|nr:hypothetical protein [Conexibacter sp. CPCC 206217]MDO8212219.1 hypothetical protein [Conexibacter sp. CPCC 206217]
MTVKLPCAATRAALNEDPEFLINARLWNVGMKLRVGEQAYLVQIEDGKVARFTDEPDQFDTWTISIGGPEDGWEKLLEPVPPPFYQDFFGAFFRHDFEMGGDLASLYASYGAVRRLLEVLRETHNLQEA